MFGVKLGVDKGAATDAPVTNFCTAAIWVA
jgi:hypothetical protein